MGSSVTNSFDSSAVAGFLAIHISLKDGSTARSMASPSLAIPVLLANQPNHESTKHLRKRYIF
jgi:hypothetical protein